MRAHSIHLLPLLLTAPPLASSAYHGGVPYSTQAASGSAAMSPSSRRRAALSSVRLEAVTQQQQQELGSAEMRGDFAILDQSVGGDSKPLIYLDSAATSQKPEAVVGAMRSHEQRDNANVHRGAHELSMRSTAAYEAARSKVASFIGAQDAREIVFTRGATEAINLVAYTWGHSASADLKEGDEIVLSVMEHHSNIVPWKLLAQQKGLTLKYARLSEDDETLDLAHLKSLVTERTKLIAVAHVSNTLGCVNPVSQISSIAKSVGAKLLLDACQSVPHMPVDVSTLGCDFLVASGHKMCGPTGIGFLWSPYELLDSLPPWQGGGEMIDQVSLTDVSFAPPPGRFEAGTPAITQAIGLGAACDYLSAIGMDAVQEYEHDVGRYLYEKLTAIEGVRVYGPKPQPADAPASAAHRAALCAFNVDGIHPSDLATFLDQEGVAIRSGHHCTQPLHAELGLAGSARASLYIYNTREEVDKLAEELVATIELFRQLEG